MSVQRIPRLRSGCDMNCPTCGATIGAMVTKCPQCGAYTSKTAAVGGGLQAIGCLIMCVLFLVFLALSFWACS